MPHDVGVEPSSVFGATDEIVQPVAVHVANSRQRFAAVCILAGDTNPTSVKKATKPCACS